MTREERLGATFVELADSLVDDFDVVDLMVLLTERCVEILDAASAGLLLADGVGNLNLIAATSEATETVELFQVQNDEGPCADCFRSGQPVTCDDLAASSATERWPRFAAVALGAGFQAADAFPLRLRGQVLGAMNLFRTRAVAMDAADGTAAQALADVATIALLQSRAISDSHVVAEQLQHALTSRIAIEQAKGIIAERLGCEMDEAFRVLRTHARAGGLRLAVVAQEVVAGTLRPDALRAARGG
jgi:transcriptional regulator with GAF, ATPase, and Fis domain